MRCTKSFLSLAVMASLLFIGPIPRSYSQQIPDKGKILQGRESASQQRLKERPQRYPGAIVGLEVIADLTVDPTMYKGECPGTFTFKGKIATNRPGPVHYRFIRSDNTRSELLVLNFDEPGTKEVTTTWQFDGPSASPDFTGWQAIQVSFPMKVQSNTALFRGTCTNERKPAPQKPVGPMPGPQRDSKPLTSPVP